MTVITHDLEAIGGGFGAYDIGVGFGRTARAVVDLLADMGSEYTPTL